MSWCGQPWTSDELVAAGALDVVYACWPYAQMFRVERAHHVVVKGVELTTFLPVAGEHPKPPHLDHLVDGNRYAGLTRVDDDGRAHVPALPGRWPRCPMCDAPLHRVRTGDAWICEPPQLAHLELGAA